MPTFVLERKTDGPVAGIDEVGRGTLAGPVCAAAVILNPRKLPKGVDDSKALSESARERLHDEIMRTALAVSVGMASVKEIDDINILQATMLAMRRAVHGLKPSPVLALVDGNRVPDDLPCPAQAVIKGDAKVLSIAAASIIAKVTRDRLMRQLDETCPGYHWGRNKGYGTADHLEALARLGATPHHRTSFAPVAEVMRKAAS